MNRNQNSRFYQNPVNLDIGRSRFKMPHEVKTTFNVGQIIPFDVQEVLPGDTFQYKTSKAIRMQPLVSAPMDNLFLDTYYFFVPNRLVWDHWKEFMGENTQSAWIPQTTYTVPHINFFGGAYPGSIADYMGIPTSITAQRIVRANALPFRAYAMICNEWFRDENLRNYMHIDTDDTIRTAYGDCDNYDVNNFNDEVIAPALGGAPYIACKTHDYFTSALPGPQKGPDVSVLGGSNPVYFSDTLQQKNSFVKDNSFVPRLSTYNTSLDSVSVVNAYMSLSGSSWQTIPYYDHVQPNNWFVDSPSITINALRLAFQIQKLYEKEARSGSRYIEILKGHFGVTAPDASLQRPQYLGGSRKYINVNQVIQTSESGNTPQGNIAGYSLTSDTNNDFIQSFTEHGFIIGVMVARYDHTYQQGLNRMWSRKNKLDYYFPVLANIGEQPILNKEIYCDINQAPQNEVFGYQEAWADYRYRPNIVTGEMRSNLSNSLDSWHFADDYNALPTLGDSWIKEDKSNIDRVLAVQSNVSNQLFADILIDCVATRPMPLYSIPGLIDHH